MALLPIEPGPRKKALMLLLAVVVATWWAANTYFVKPLQAEVHRAEAAVERLRMQNAGAREVLLQRDSALTQTEIESIYRRETFVYPADARRDPFSPLDVETGPSFENLDLVGIVFGGAGGSVATVIDRATDKRYRLRRGDIVGNARAVEIRPDAIIFQVTVFGVTRSETLSLGADTDQQ